VTTTPYQQDLADIYDMLYRHGVAKDYAAEAADLAALIRCRNPRAASLLDVACGTGAHLAHLRKSFDPVAGVELSAAMRRVATARLPGVPIHPGDLRDFALDVTFDSVTCLFSSVGYLRGVNELRAAVGRMAAHLNPGGVLVIEPWFTPDQWLDGHVSHTVAQLDDRTVVRMGFSSRDERRTSRMHMYYLVGDAGTGVRQFEEEHILTLFTVEEYEQALAAAGLTGIRWVDGWAEGRERLIATR
jgi:SAM-dependent methyltransferase